MCRIVYTPISSLITSLQAYWKQLCTSYDLDMKDFFADSLSHLLHHIQLDPSQSHLDPANHPSSLINRKKTALYDDLAVYDQYPSATIWLITDVTINRSDSHIQDLRHALHTYLPLLW